MTEATDLGGPLGTKHLLRQHLTNLRHLVHIGVVDIEAGRTFDDQRIDGFQLLPLWR